MKSTARTEGLQDEFNDHVFRTKASHNVFVDIGCVQPAWRGMGSARLQICPRHTMITKTSLNHIPDRSQPRSKMTAPPAVHQDGYATSAPTKKILGRNDITIGRWNVRTLRAAGKLKELTHEMEIYIWNLLGLVDIR